MLNDETQEVVTSQNDDEQEVETEVETEESEPIEESTDWKAEAAKWKAIAKRKAQKAEAAQESTPKVDAMGIDADLAETVYRNTLSASGVTTKEAQDKAFELAKKTGVSVPKLLADPDMVELLKAKDKAARTRQSVASATGGATVTRTDTGRLANAIAQGKPVKESDLTGEQALQLLGIRR